MLTFVNTDVIAQGLAGFDPDSAAIEASRIMLERLHNLAAQRADFAFETTLAARTLASWLRGLRQDGYSVRLVYFWVKSADLAVTRVARRVAAGGHAVSEATVRQRYRRGLENFLRLYRPVVSTWHFYDNTEEGSPSLVAFGDETGSETIVVEETWKQILEATRT